MTEKRGRGRPPKNLKPLEPEQFISESDILLPAVQQPKPPIRPLNPKDPSQIERWPSTLPVEHALGLTDDPEKVYKAYKLAPDEWFAIQIDPDFQAVVEAEREQLKKPGASFQKKAALQAEEILRTSWKLIHDPNTPAPQKADLIKSTVRWAGYDNKGDVNVGQQVGLSIQIVMRDRGDK